MSEKNQNIVSSPAEGAAMFADFFKFWNMHNFFV